MTVGFVPQRVALIESNAAARDTMSDPWYRYMQELYQHSGLAGQNFPLYQNVTCPALGMFPDGGAPPSIVAVVGNLQTLAFAAAAVERVAFTLHLPHSYTRATKIIPTVVWAPTDASFGNVRWLFECSVVPNGEVVEAPASFVIDGAAVGTAKMVHVLQADDAAIEAFDTSEFRGGSIVCCSLQRDGTSLYDTYGADALLFAAGFIVQNSALGARGVVP